MNMINRHNYEEYFLLYTDNELDVAEKNAVEEFVQQNPDLKIELEMLQQSILKAEPIVFHSKDVLLKNSSPMINQGNYEEYFVLYGDDELTNEQKDCVEQFVYNNSQYQAEFELIQQVKMQADRYIVFPDKAILYRTEKEDEKVFVLRWWKVAVASIVFIFLSGLGWYTVSKDNIKPSIVKTKPGTPHKLPVPGKPEPKLQTTVQAKPNVTGVITPQSTIAVIAKEKNGSLKSYPREKQLLPQKLIIVEEEGKNIAGRNIHVSTTVTQERPKVNIQEMETSNTIALQSKKIDIDEGVSSGNEKLYAYAASNDEIEILNTTISKKNKLRGLLRKVSRVVEKTTNIEPGENSRGIRIANFEIALK